jgi:hypothetical protein
MENKMNKNNGRKHNYLIEDVKYMDNTSGIELKSDRVLSVWADEGFNKSFEGIEGITSVYSGQPEKTHYNIYVDPRYEIEFIKSEIEAVIVCKQDEEL